MLIKMPINDYFYFIKIFLFFCFRYVCMPVGVVLCVWYIHKCVYVCARAHIKRPKEDTQCFSALFRWDWVSHQTCSLPFCFFFFLARLVASEAHESSRLPVSQKWVIGTCDHTLLFPWLLGNPNSGLQVFTVMQRHCVWWDIDSGHSQSPKADPTQWPYPLSHAKGN